MAGGNNIEADISNSSSSALAAQYKESSTETSTKLEHRKRPSNDDGSGSDTMVRKPKYSETANDKKIFSVSTSTLLQNQSDGMDEKAKKQKSSSAVIGSSTDKGEVVSGDEHLSKLQQQQVSSTRPESNKSINDITGPKNYPIIDMESALDVLLQTEKNQQDEIIHERSTNDGEINIKTITFAHFRRGQSGDAPSLASLCRKQQQQQQQQQIQTQDTNISENSFNGSTLNNEDTSSLEMMLASGFGDEHTPPAFYAILTEIYTVVETSSPALSNTTSSSSQTEKLISSNSDSAENIKPENEKVTDMTCTTTTTTSKHPSLAGASILCLEWDASQSARILKSEFFHVDTTIDTMIQSNGSVAGLLARRILLRMATLALVNGCQMLRFEETSGFPSVLQEIDKSLDKKDEENDKDDDYEGEVDIPVASVLEVAKQVQVISKQDQQGYREPPVSP